MVSSLSSSSNHNNNSNSSADLPPANNPIKIAYEEFMHTTPYVTRTIIIIQVVSYLLSWFMDPYYALATIPQFIWGEYEIYRLILSPFFVNTSLFSIIITYYTFLPIGVRFERCIGSTFYGYMCCLIGTVTNVLFCGICIAMYYMTDGNPAHLLHSSAGIWNILFGIIAYECCQSPRDMKRKFFLWDIPVVYYPLVVLLFVMLLGGGSSSSGSYILSTGIGYAFGSNHPLLDGFKLSSNTIRTLEEGYLHSMTRADGWITGPAALGSNAWAYEVSSAPNETTSRSRAQVRT